MASQPLTPSVRVIWERALSPAESCRLAGPGAPPLLQESEAKALAEKWEARLRFQFPDADIYDKRLKALGLGRDDTWKWLAGHKPPSGQPVPSWALFLLEAQPADSPAQPHCLGDAWDRFTPCEKAFLPQDPDSLPLFPAFFRPFVAQGLLRLRQRLPPGTVTVDEGAFQELGRHLLFRLAHLGARALALDQQIKKKQGALLGSTPEERYANYLEQAASPAARWEFLASYPVLARLIGTSCEHFINNALRLLERLRADRASLAEFLGAPLDRIVAWHGGLSDPHHDGQTVAILGFASGARVVYKPRSLVADRFYSRLLDWWNGLRKGEALRATRVLDRPGYGWAEFLTAEPCRDQEEITTYFRRQGQLTAFLYFLGGIDFHAENFVACGAFPVPIDLEGLLAPWPGFVETRYWNVPPAFRPVGFSPYLTGMLPGYCARAAGGVCYSISGLAGTSARAWPDVSRHWGGLGTDQLRLLKTSGSKSVEHSLPRLAGQTVRAQDYIGEIQAGFALTYRALVEQRAALLGPEGLLARPPDMLCRCVLRQTYEYKERLQWSLAPDHLTSGAAHDLAFDMLCRQPAPLGDEFTFVDQEKPALWRRDVPIYYGHPGEREIVNDQGVRIGAIPSASSYEQTVKRLMAGSEEELAWFNEMLRSALQVASQPTPASAATANSEDAFLHGAEAIGEALVRMALRTSHGLGWLTLVRHNPVQKAVNYSHAGPYLYNGAAGIALFLANLAHASGEDRWVVPARAGLDFAEAMASHIPWETYHQPHQPAGMEGPLSIAYALAEASRLLNDRSLLERACRLGYDFEAAAGPVDLVGGMAGNLLVLLKLYHASGDEGFLRKARQLARNLQGQPLEDTYLLGMSHGHAGLACALGACHAALGESWLQERAEASLAYLDENYCHDFDDWPDFRTTREPTHIMTGWCGGAPGIGLAYLSLAVATKKPALLDGVERAVQATLKHLALGPHHLCCGLAGRLWLLSEAASLLERPELLQTARAAGKDLLAHHQGHGTWDLGDFTEGNTVPSLMRGIAGIGLAFLQLREPGAVSKVLTLA